MSLVRDFFSASPLLAPLCTVSTTVATLEQARALARQVLAQRLAACVQIEAITSMYRWQGVEHEEVEQRLVCKTVPAAVDALVAQLRAVHPYAVPELLVQPAQASLDYVAWVQAEVPHAPPPGHDV